MTRPGLFASLLVLTAPAAFAQPAPPDPQARYQALLADAKTAADPAAIDWRALRYAYADLPSFQGEADDEDRAAMFKASKAHDWAATGAAAQKVLDTSFLDPAAHYLLGVAYARQNRPADAQHETAIGQALIASIKTGDGLSYDTAYTVITVAEEYDVLGIDGYALDQQSLSQHDGHVYDVMACKDGDGKPVTFYFNIDREWAAEARMFGGGK